MINESFANMEFLFFFIYELTSPNHLTYHNPQPNLRVKLNSLQVLPVKAGDRIERLPKHSAERMREEGQASPINKIR